MPAGPSEALPSLREAGVAGSVVLTPATFAVYPLPGVIS